MALLFMSMSYLVHTQIMAVPDTFRYVLLELIATEIKLGYSMQDWCHRCGRCGKCRTSFVHSPKNWNCLYRAKTSKNNNNNNEGGQELPVEIKKMFLYIADGRALHLNKFQGEHLRYDRYGQWLYQFLCEKGTRASSERQVVTPACIPRVHYTCYTC